MIPLTQQELRQLAQWINDVLVPDPNFALFIQELNNKLKSKDREIRNQQDGSTAWKRGYAAGLEYVITLPQNIITEFVEGDTTETPAADEE